MTSARQIPPFLSTAYGWLVLLLFGTALLIRIWHLGEQTLWLDETVHLIQAKNFLLNGQLITGNDNNGLLFTVLLVPVSKLFGLSIEGARGISVVFGIGSVALIYLIARRLFSAPVAVMALTLATFSPYLVFWSKMARNYSIFLFFVLLATFQIIHLVNIDREEKKGISLTKGLPLVCTLMAGFFAHYLMLLFIGTVFIWLILLNKTRIAALIKNNIKAVVIAAVLVIAAFWLLSGNKELLAWATPDWQHLTKLYQDAPWYSLSAYSNVLLYDWPYAFIFVGVALVFLFLHKKFSLLYFFICCLFLPFLLLSFVFREPTAARYLIFIYPFFLMLAAYGLYEIGTLIQQRVRRFFTVPRASIALVVSVLLLLPMFPFKNLPSVFKFSFSATNKPDSRIIECVFSDWKYTCAALKNRLQPTDAILATLPQIASVYLDRNDVGAFRQLHLDMQQKKYVPNAPDAARKSSAQTTQDLVRTVRNNDRGWLLADFYLEGVMTDPAARNFVFQHLHFYPAASVDGSILLFGWNKASAEPSNQNMIMQIGRSDQAFSRDLTFQVPAEVLQKPFIQMRYRTKFVEAPGEAALEMNGFQFPLAISNQNTDFQLLTVPVTALRRGQNVFRFSYIAHPAQEQFQGYVLYYLEFLP